MKRMKIVSAVFALIGLCAAAAAVFLSFAFKDASPILLTQHYTAKSQAVAVMNAICKGDFEGASQRMLGNPDLGLDREPAEAVGVLMWDSYKESLSYELDGDCYTTDTGLAQDVTLTCLDLSSVSAALKERYPALLAERVENAEDLFQVYDENDNYQEAFVMEVLYDAAAAVLEEAPEMTVDLTLNLTYQDDQWWVAADTALLDAITGGVLY